MKKYHKMISETLKEKLELHKKWLSGAPDGERAILTLAYLEGANLTEANLREADLRDADLRGADLEGAILTEANLTEANLREADLRDADLRGADLEVANLEGAILTRANLERADLRGADLTRANLIGANLRDANLEGVNLDYSALPLQCSGLDFTIDENLAKQIAYHLINLMQYSNLDVGEIFKKSVFEWLEDSHLVTKHELPILQMKGGHRK